MSLWDTKPDTRASGIVIEEFKPRRSGALRGHARVRLPSGMILEDVGVFVGTDSIWCSMPAKPMLDANGVAIRDERGKVRYLSMVNFITRAKRDALTRQIIAAISSKYPEALDE